MRLNQDEDIVTPVRFLAGAHFNFCDAKWSRVSTLPG